MGWGDRKWMTKGVEGVPVDGDASDVTETLEGHHHKGDKTCDSLTGRRPGKTWGQQKLGKTVSIWWALGRDVIMDRPTQQLGGAKHLDTI